ncbi:MAG: fibronectin type III domain-containing protein [Eubacterium sp.]|nr:fibronectin type III domain-containing protein [Eubacterium sp.]
MNIKKITAFAAAVVMAAGILTAPIGGENGLAINASANTVNGSIPDDVAQKEHFPTSSSAVGGGGKITVKWTAVSGAKSYSISASKKQADGSYKTIANETVTDTSCTINNLPADTYSVFIQPDNASIGVILDDVVVSEALTAEVKLYNDNTADITWNEIDDTYYYKVYVSINDVVEMFGMEMETTLDSNNFYFSTSSKKDFTTDGKSVKAISETKYTVDLSAVPKTGFAAISVYAYGKNGKSITGTDTIYTSDLKVNKRSTSSSSASAKVAAPANFKASKKTNSITLKWDAVEGADMYRVYKYNPETKKYEKYKDVKSAKCTVSGLSANTKYKFKVTAYDKVDGKYVKGGTSKAVSVTTKK